jgi:[ribosomal protein S5]-alanine N-acetyltransferase
MREGLEALLKYLCDVMRLHRVHANYLPINVRSGRLLARLGFRIEGYARDYLFNDRWHDHVLTSITHPNYDNEWLKPRAATLRTP